MNHEQLKIYVALGLVPGLGASRILRLMQSFSDPLDIFKATQQDLLQIPGFGKTITANIIKFDDWTSVDRILKFTDGTDAWLVTLDQEQYPKRLQHIYDPPHILWGRGDVKALSRPGIAIVGTRKPTRYGREKAGLFARQIAQTGLSVISGLAYGIDTLAHTAAVDAHGCTIGVLGSGIDRIYPGANRRLADRIVDTGGAIISEFVPGTKPDRENFPVRNRVVSGLSNGVLVVESDVTGGSMITAYSALDQGREVFAIPHDITTVTGKGCNTMIKKGHAKLTMCLDDILEELNLDLSLLKLPDSSPELQQHLFDEENNGVEKVLKVSKHPSWRAVDGLAEDMKELCLLLELGGLHIDELAEKTGRPGYLLLGTLLELEMKAIVKAKSGKRFELLNS